MKPLDELVTSPNGFGFRADTGEVFQLNAIARDLISWVRAGESADEMARRLAEAYSVPIRRTRCDVATFLDHLAALDLLEFHEK